MEVDRCVEVDVCVVWLACVVVYSLVVLRSNGGGHSVGVFSLIMMWCCF